jgi:hypothetical protein
MRHSFSLLPEKKDNKIKKKLNISKKRRNKKLRKLIKKKKKRIYRIIYRRRKYFIRHRISRRFKFNAYYRRQEKNSKTKQKPIFNLTKKKPRLSAGYRKFLLKFSLHKSQTPLILGLNNIQKRVLDKFNKRKNRRIRSVRINYIKKRKKKTLRKLMLKLKKGLQSNKAILFELARERIKNILKQISEKEKVRTKKSQFRRKRR